MPTVRVKETEPVDVVIRRFKRICEKAGIMTECRRRETYEKPTAMRKRKAAAARKRAMKKLLREDPMLAKLSDKVRGRGAKGSKGGKGGRGR